MRLLRFGHLCIGFEGNSDNYEDNANKIKHDELEFCRAKFIVIRLIILHQRAKLMLNSRSKNIKATDRAYCIHVL